MYIDPFNKKSIYDEYFWQKSQCIWHENALMNFLRSLLISANYVSTDDSEKVWKNNNNTIIVCLVDDVRSCSLDYNSDFPYLYDKNTTVITDNKITCPTQFEILQLPESFFGIYSHQIFEETWNPIRDFTFAINRLDNKRLEIMLEITKRNDLNQAHINFNCFQHGHNDPSHVFAQQWQQLPDETKQYYEDSYNHIKNLVPLRNYDFEHELSYYRSFLNIVVESYSSDHVIAFSEKIFRALTTPVPWTLFSGRYSVAYLERLGFDVLSDLVDHNAYDKLLENQNKIDAFIWQGNRTISEIKKLDFNKVQQRCKLAAIHNQEILANLRHNWPKDLGLWMKTFSSQLVP